ncbi:MAG: iron ABC transporter permease [Oscillospiraceae bacterium]|nr:iron ABC transporter permease [Oscillospiraceae bacterium]
MQTGLEEIRALRRADRAEHRRLWAGIWLAMLCAFLFALCHRGIGFGFITPLEALRSVGTFLWLKLAGLFSRAPADGGASLTAALPHYAETVMRFRSVLLMMAGGAALALAGTIYQTAMRNPMAVPTMLGVSSGVNLAQLLLVIEYGSVVYQLTTTRYIYNYGISIAILLIVLLGGKIAGGKRASVADMLIVGTVVNRLINIVVNYLRTELDTETLTLLQEYSESSYNTYNQFYNLGILVGVSLLLLLPIFLMRFSYNAASFEDGDATSLGVRPGAMRVYGLVAGALLTTTAMLHCGNVGVMALIVPHLCRYLFGADFRRLCWGSAAGGALLMLVAEIISGFVYFEDYQIPIGNIVSLAALPVMVWVMLRERHGWE